MSINQDQDWKIVAADICTRLKKSKKEEDY